MTTILSLNYCPDSEHFHLILTFAMGIAFSYIVPHGQLQYIVCYCFRERERAHDLERERSREAERDRAQSRLSSTHSSPGPLRDAERRHSIDDRNRSLERHHSHSDSQRSRSRSPLRNGPDESHRKTDSALSDSAKSDIRVKEEPRKDIPITLDEPPRRPELKLDPRPDLLHPYPPLTLPHNPLLDQMRPPNPYLPRPPGHPSLWNPFEPRPPLPDLGVRLELGQRIELSQRLDLQREVEALERERLLQRFPNPLTANPLATMISHERLREHDLLMRQTILRERENMERIAHMERERAAEIERAKLAPGLRPGDPLGLSHPLYGTSSLLSNSVKPPQLGPMLGLGLGGTLPPPLIPSGTVRSHTNSPATPKTKPATPTSATVSSQESGRDKPSHSSTNGHDSEAQSR